MVFIYILYITKKGIDFVIRKRVSENFIIKEIEVNQDQEIHHYIEKVQALDLDKMKYFAKAAGLEIEETFGDYGLNPFDKDNSDRLILILK